MTPQTMSHHETIHQTLLKNHQPANQRYASLESQEIVLVKPMFNHQNSIEFTPLSPRNLQKNV